MEKAPKECDARLDLEGPIMSAKPFSIRESFGVTWEFLTAHPDGTHDECWIWALSQDKYRDQAIANLTESRELIESGGNQAELLQALDEAIEKGRPS